MLITLTCSCPDMKFCGIFGASVGDINVTCQSGYNKILVIIKLMKGGKY